MKRIFMILVTAAMVAVVGCDTKKEKEAGDQNMAMIDSLKQALSQSQSELGDLTATVSQVMEGFSQINEAEGRINHASAEGIDKKAIAEDMAFIQRQMQLNREQIKELKSQLKNSKNMNTSQKAKLEGIIAGLQTQLDQKTKDIEELRAQLAEKDIQIAEQGEQIKSLNTNVSQLNAANEEKAQVVAAQDKELNTAFYVFGTKKELKEQSILKSGDVLKSNDFNKDYFTRIDQRVTKVIKLYSKNAVLKTNHPAGSYSLDKDADGQYTLRITNPQLFWSVSKYLVIIVK